MSVFGFFRKKCYTINERNIACFVPQWKARLWVK